MDKTIIAGLTLNHINAGVVIGTTTTYTMPAATSCSIRGKFGTPLAIQAANAGTTPTTDATTGVTFVTLTANQAAVVVWGVNAAGAMVASQGPATPTVTGVTTTVGAFISAPQFPSLPEDFCPVAYQVIRVAPSSTGFTFGASNWTGSPAYATCATIVNIATLPDRLQVS